jgi:excisionase family DNA binding protein
MQTSGKIAMSIDDVMGAIGVSRATVYNLINRGELKPFKIGSVTRFKASDIHAWIDGLATSADA